MYPEPIRVNYKVVRKLVPSLWETYNGRKVDIVIHIGMAGPRPFYCIERRGHRDGYKHTDVDGEKVDEEEERKPGSDWVWRGLPEEIETDLDPEDVLKRWQGHSAVSSTRLCLPSYETLTASLEGHGPANLGGCGKVSVRFHLLFEPGATLERGEGKEGGLLPRAGGCIRLEHHQRTGTSSQPDSLDCRERGEQEEAADRAPK